MTEKTAGINTVIYIRGTWTMCKNLYIMSSFADYRTHHHTGFEQRLVDSDGFKRQRNIVLSEHYNNRQIEKTDNVFFGKLQKQVENDKLQIQICHTKMTEMESAISDFQHNQQSLHYIINQLNQKINNLD